MGEGCGLSVASGHEARRHILSYNYCVMTIIACPKCGAKNRVDPGAAASARPVCGKCRQPLPEVTENAYPITVTDESFDELVLRNPLPVLLDCWAPWCGPCRALAPTLEQLAAESAGRYVVAKLNTDENPQTARRFRIDSIPTLLLFKGGSLADVQIGLASKDELAAMLARAM